MRRALDAVIHGGAEADTDPVDSGTSHVQPTIDPADEAPTVPVDAAGMGSGAAGTADAVQSARAGSIGTWEALVRFEEARWLRYGHPCVAAHLEVVGGQDVTTRLGDDAGARLRARLDHLLSTATRASDRYEPRAGWRLVALLPETDLAGATTALERIQAAFADLMGPALAVRIAFGLAAPAPTGTLTVAFHQANQLLAAQRRHLRPGTTRSESDDRADGGAIAATPRQRAGGDEDETSRPTPMETSSAHQLDLGARLDVLRRLLEGGYISETEYLAKRTQILDRL